MKHTKLQVSPLLQQHSATSGISKERLKMNLLQDITLLKP